MRESIGSKGMLGVMAVALLLVAGPVALAGKGGNGGGGGGGKGGGGGDGGSADPAILFVMGDDIGVMDADGGNPRLVLADSGNLVLDPSFTPDGSQAVFAGYGPQGPGVYTVNLDGTGLTQVTTLQSVFVGGPQVSPAPAPDGQVKILFSDETPDGMTDLFLVDLDGTSRVNLTQTTLRAEDGASWSPDATRIVSTMISLDPLTLFQDCYVYDLGLIEGQVGITNEVSIVNLPGSPLQNNTDLYWPDWANTSDVIAITATVPTGGSSYDIWVIDLMNPTAPQNVTGGLGKVERSSSWAPDDSALVYWGTGSGPDGVFRLDAGSSGPVRLIRDGSHPCWRGF